eukprot:PLAT5936.1.p1 GENE.PLAT5936.1~~PLAT5936.1.p1  ORF type:complete len:533 (+),score=137.24 PLAT5936.1:48-1601(+)
MGDSDGIDSSVPPLLLAMAPQVHYALLETSEPSILRRSASEAAPTLARPLSPAVSLASLTRSHSRGRLSGMPTGKMKARSSAPMLDGLSRLQREAVSLSVLLHPGELPADVLQRPIPTDTLKELVRPKSSASGRPVTRGSRGRPASRAASTGGDTWRRRQPASARDMALARVGKRYRPRRLPKRSLRAAKLRVDSLEASSTHAAASAASPAAIRAERLQARAMHELRYRSLALRAEQEQLLHRVQFEEARREARVRDVMDRLAFQHDSSHQRKMLAREWREAREKSISADKKTRQALAKAREARDRQRLEERMALTRKQRTAKRKKQTRSSSSSSRRSRRKRKSAAGGAHASGASGGGTTAREEAEDSGEREKPTTAVHHHHPPTDVLLLSDDADVDAWSVSDVDDYRASEDGEHEEKAAEERGADGSRAKRTARSSSRRKQQLLRREDSVPTPVPAALAEPVLRPESRAGSVASLPQRKSDGKRRGSRPRVLGGGFTLSAVAARKRAAAWQRLQWE